MKFNSADEIYVEIVDNHQDLYFPESGVYLFEYNDVGSVAYYYLSMDELLRIADEVGPDNYVGGALGVGGYILDPCMILPNGDVVEYNDPDWDIAYRNEDAVIDYSPITEFLEQFVGEECISAMPEDLLKE